MIEPKPFSNCSVAPAICAPCDAPFVVGDVNGKRLKMTTRLMLYSPPRSTCHHAEPSHVDMYVRSPTVVPETPSIWMTPMTPLADEYLTGSSVYCPLDDVFLFKATFVNVVSKTKILRDREGLSICMMKVRRRML